MFVHNDDFCCKISDAKHPEVHEARIANRVFWREILGAGFKPTVFEVEDRIRYRLRRFLAGLKPAATGLFVL